MNSYTTIIIDDEKNVREALSALIHQYCPEVKVFGLLSSADEGRNFLKTNKPDIVFLDISMPGEDGFTFLKSLGNIDFGLIFVTAFQEYALKALKANAIDYLLKPVNPFELQEAVRKAVYYIRLRIEHIDANNIYKESIQNLNEHIHSRSKQIQKLTIAEQFGFRVINVNEIIYLEADTNYTILHLTEKRQVIATRNLGEFEKLLESPEFFRIHKSTIINLHYLSGYSSYQGNFAEMQDGTRLIISRRKLSEFRDYIKQFFNTGD